MYNSLRDSAWMVVQQVHVHHNLYKAALCQYHTAFQ
jgi:hypothetical protein